MTDENQVRVGDVMTKRVVTVDPSDALLVADEMQKNFRCRHMPVVDAGGSLVGILSQRDMFHSGLLKAMGIGKHGRNRALESVLVGDIMLGDVLTTTPNTPLAEAARLMADRQIGCLPVLDDDQLVGILSESDVVRVVARE